MSNIRSLPTKLAALSIGTVVCLMGAGSAGAQACQCSLEERVLAVLKFGSEPTDTVISAPTQVRAGQEFQITITSYGGGCDRAGEEGVVYTTSGVTITVYDVTSATRPEVVCPAILKRLTHNVTLSFSQPGQAVIQAFGRHTGSGLNPAGEPVVLRRTVVVNPG